MQYSLLIWSAITYTLVASSVISNVAVSPFFSVPSIVQVSSPIVVVPAGSCMYTLFLHTQPTKLFFLVIVSFLVFLLRFAIATVLQTCTNNTTFAPRLYHTIHPMYIPIAKNVSKILTILRQYDKNIPSINQGLPHKGDSPWLFY